MTPHPVFEARLDAAARSLRQNPCRSVAENISRTCQASAIAPEAAFRLGINYFDPPGHLADPDTGRRTTRNLADLSNDEAAALLERRDPVVLAPAHLTLATSCHLMTNHVPAARPELVAQLEATARRIVWQGRPYIPAVRWEFPDGSALVQEGGEIRAALHASRYDQVRDAYLEIVRRRESMDPGNFYHAPLVPNVAFAPASDGILSHQAALPAGTARCWCGRHPRTESERRVNRVMF